MAKQVIGIGTVANDGTGDQIRDAFDKVNDNFTELYDFFTIGIALSDPSTDLVVASSVYAFDMPFAFEIKRVYASVKTAPTGSALTLDINDEGTTILSLDLSISASANNAETSTFTGSASSYTFSKGDLISFDITQVGSTVKGAGLIVFLEGIRG